MVVIAHSWPQLACDKIRAFICSALCGVVQLTTISNSYKGTSEFHDTLFLDRLPEIIRWTNCLFSHTWSDASIFTYREIFANSIQGHARSLDENSELTDSTNQAGRLQATDPGATGHFYSLKVFEHWLIGDRLLNSTQKTSKMAITIIQPKPAVQHVRRDEGASSDSDSENGGVDLDGDVSMSLGKPTNHSSDIVTPGEVITEDTQYMR